MEVDPEDILEAIPEEADSYDELAAAEPEVPKRGRGRPKGSRNKPKMEKTEEVEEIEEIDDPLPPPPSPRPIPKPKIRKSRAKPLPAPANVEFDDGYGANPRKQAIPQRAQSSSTDLMHVLAAFAKEHGAREKDRRRGFYESYLPN